MAWTLSRTVISLACATGLLAAACSSSGTATATTSTTINPDDLPWAEEHRLNDTGGKLAFNPDGTKLYLTGPSRGMERVWDVETQTLTNLDIGRDAGFIAVNNNGVIAVVVNLNDHTEAKPNETTIDSEPEKEQPRYAIRLRDPETAETLFDIPDQSGRPHFSPDGTYLAAASRYDSELWELNVWSAKTGELLHAIDNLTSDITEIEFTPDSSRIITTNDDNAIRIWDVQTGNLLTTLGGEPTDKAPGQGTVSPDGNFYAVDNNDDTIFIWNLETEQLEKKIPFDSLETRFLTSLEYSPDGTQLAAGGLGTSGLFDVETGSLIQRFPPSDFEVFVNVVFSPDGKRLAISDVADERGRGKYTVIYKQNPK